MMLGVGYEWVTYLRSSEKNNLTYVEQAMNAAVQLRHALHAHPELSGCEIQTSERIRQFFEPLEADEVLTGIGGAGLAFCFGSSDNGPTIMLRCELDGLPIHESTDVAHRSEINGASHACGHDGHMAILAAVGERLAVQRPARGRVVLLFQPAEETGAGARAVVADAAFQKLRPDWVFGLHNLPGYPLGQLVVRGGTFTCASRGMRISLRGKSAHAAQPETGTTPAGGLTRILDALGDLPVSLAGRDELMFATVVGANMGGRNFGLVPDRAELCATLRCETDTTMRALVAWAERRAEEIAKSEGLGIEIGYEDVFDATENDDDAVACIMDACEGMPMQRAVEPFRWSEDFGQFTQRCKGAFFGLGAGNDAPDLHNDDYDFPDELVAIGAEMFLRILSNKLEESFI